MPQLYDINNKAQCCGCSACFSICPTKAISLVADSEGFLYPVINNNKCVECNKCYNVCPLKSENKTERQHKTEKFIAVKHQQKEIIKSSSSGGVFTALSDYILKNNGVIYGVVYDENFNAVHTRADNEKTRDDMRISKYLQSDLKDAFYKVEKDLKNGITVLFTGTPCQNAGLKKYLCKDYDNLYTVDLICHGVPSPLMFKEHIKLIEKKTKLKIKSYKCRSKVKGWHNHIEEAEFENGKTKAGTFLLQEHKILFYAGYILRPSCYECQFTNLYRCADITLGDFWGIEKQMPDWDDQLGTSMILINTSKGEQLFESFKKDIHFRISPSYGRQPQLEKSASKPKDRKEFWTLYERHGYKYIAAKYGKNNIKAKAKFYIKKILKKFLRK